MKSGNAIFGESRGSIDDHALLNLISLYGMGNYWSGKAYFFRDKGAGVVIRFASKKVDNLLNKAREEVLKLCDNASTDSIDFDVYYAAKRNLQLLLSVYTRELTLLHDWENDSNFPDHINFPCLQLQIESVESITFTKADLSIIMRSAIFYLLSQEVRDRKSEKIHQSIEKNLEFLKHWCETNYSILPTKYQINLADDSNLYGVLYLINSYISIAGSVLRNGRIVKRESLSGDLKTWQEFIPTCVKLIHDIKNMPQDDSGKRELATKLLSIWIYIVKVNCEQDLSYALDAELRVMELVAWQKVNMSNTPFFFCILKNHFLFPQLNREHSI